MGFRNREKEVKLEILNQTSLHNVATVIAMHIGSKAVVHDTSTDVYFSVPKTLNKKLAKVAKFPFLRVRRKGENGSSELTLKYEDRGGNKDRVEIDARTLDYDNTIEILSLITGNSVGKITKEYYVFFLDNNNTTISVYTVLGQKTKKLYLEIESTSLKRVYSLKNQITKACDLDLKDEPKSLYRLFIKKGAQS
jgi:adenylate cyclase class IV